MPRHKPTEPPVIAGATREQRSERLFLGVLAALGGPGDEMLMEVGASLDALVDAAAFIIGTAPEPEAAFARFVDDLASRVTLAGAIFADHPEVKPETSTRQ